MGALAAPCGKKGAAEQPVEKEGGRETERAGEREGGRERERKEREWWGRVGGGGCGERDGNNRVSENPKP